MAANKKQWAGSFAAVAFLCLTWLVPTLIGHEPWKPDEAYSFGLVWHILQTGDWVVPTLAGDPFMEKPPLFYLTAAAFAKLFHPWLSYPDGARLAAGFYIALALTFTALAAQRICARGRDALVALVACSGLMMWAHLMITDTALLAGVAFALYGVSLVRQGANFARTQPYVGGALLGTGTGIAFMAKGLLGPGMLALTALGLLAFQAWRTRTYLACLGIAVLAALPWMGIWPTALYLRNPELFREWFWVNNIERFTGAIELASANRPFFYFGILPFYALPLCVLAVAMLVRNRIDGGLRRRLEIPLVAIVAMLLVLSVAHDARDVYALPMLLPLAILAVAALGKLPSWLETTLHRVGLAALCASGLGLWLAWITLETGTPQSLADALQSYLPNYVFANSVATITLALLYTFGCIALLFALRHERTRPLLPWALSHTLVLGLIAALFLPTLDYGKSYRGPAFTLAQNLPLLRPCVASIGLGEPQRAMLDYYTGLITARVRKPSETSCAWLLVQNNFQLPLEADRQTWELRWQGSRPGDDAERIRLLSRRTIVRQVAQLDNGDAR